MIWLEAIRPKTLVASIAPVLIGITLARTIHPLTCFLSFLTALSLQIGANLSNDYFDFKRGADTEKRKGPRRITQSGLVALDKIKKAIFIPFLIASFSTLYLIYEGGIIIALLLMLGIFIAVIYTAGPFALAYLGLGDLIVFFVFGPIAVTSTFFLQMHTFSYKALLAGLGPGFFSMAILIVNNIRDIDEDRASGKRTLAVRFGKFFSKAQYIFCLTSACIIPLFFTPWHYLASACIFPAFFLMKQLIEEKELNHLLAQTGKLLLLYSLLFAYGNLSI